MRCLRSRGWGKRQVTNWTWPDLYRVGVTSATSIHHLHRDRIDQKLVKCTILAPMHEHRTLCTTRDHHARATDLR